MRVSFAAIASFGLALVTDVNAYNPFLSTTTVYSCTSSAQSSPIIKTSTVFASASSTTFTVTTTSTLTSAASAPAATTVTKISTVLGSASAPAVSTVTEIVTVTNVVTVTATATVFGSTTLNAASSTTPASSARPSSSVTVTSGATSAASVPVASRSTFSNSTAALTKSLTVSSNSTTALSNNTSLSTTATVEVDPSFSTTSLAPSSSTASAVASASAVGAGYNATANVTATGSVTVSNTILVFAASSNVSYSATSGLEAYGIPYDLVLVPSSGITLPTLNSSLTQGNYGGIIILSEVQYDYSTGYASALTAAQFTTLYSYQVAFGIRMVRLDVYPDSTFGVNALGGCCGTDVEQLVSFSNNTGFEGANINVGATMSTENIYHYAAEIIDTNTTWEVAQYAADSAGQFTTNTTAAVINNFAGGRQQMVFFLAWDTTWSTTNTFLQHGYIHWMTRGLFVGARKSYFNTQVDDVHLTTDLYSPTNGTYRIIPSDLESHVSWMTEINTRLPSGSSYFMELGHNGNGDIIAATNSNNSAACDPDTAIYYNALPVTSLEFQKPLGTSENIWPTTPTEYVWSLACAQIDELASWFMTTANRDAFAHISHTFTHENLDNVSRGQFQSTRLSEVDSNSDISLQATYDDASREIFFNVAWLAQVGISAGRFSGGGIIPPAITGLHNGDVIRAWEDNNITMVVGDNSRPVLLNTENNWYPYITTVADNGYAGLVVMGRWPTNIFYDCDTADCTTLEWTNTASGDGEFADLLTYERTTNTRYLLALRHDPYMFHQANLRTTGISSYTVGSQTGDFSLLQIWVETITQEMARLTNWPLITMQHDAMAQNFVDRMTRDECNPNLSYKYSSDGSHITSVTVTANSNTCSVPIPVTLPNGVSATTSGSTTKDSVGSEPVIEWVTLSGSAVTLTLSTPVSIL